ncbi:hypothetical protein HPP92_014414 [Vanilla planifolia]|uniref:Uncharacterized protein n=1 Tax=Vanilla planifolia TaxID=51239 RepID=A0A835QRK8_VANPL|nr:hypothetical protein HPP92_014414 [Vanilla planifolia]
MRYTCRSENEESELKTAEIPESCGQHAICDLPSFRRNFVRSFGCFLASIQSRRRRFWGEFWRLWWACFRPKKWMEPEGSSLCVGVERESVVYRIPVAKFCFVFSRPSAPY